MPENHLCIRYWPTKQVQCTADGHINSALACPVYELNVILQQLASAPQQQQQQQQQQQLQLQLHGHDDAFTSLSHALHLQQPAPLDLTRGNVQLQNTLMHSHK